MNTISQIITAETHNHDEASLSGATFADKLIRGYSSCATLGANNCEYSDVLTRLLRIPKLMLDFSQDIKVVEWCGILKNV